MTLRDTGARVRADSHSTNTSETNKSQTGRLCILKCEDEEGNRRVAMKNSLICETCDKRITRQAEQKPAWRIHRQAVLNSWIAGFEYKPNQHRRKG